MTTPTRGRHFSAPAAAPVWHGILVLRSVVFAGMVASRHFKTDAATYDAEENVPGNFVDARPA